MRKENATRVPIKFTSARDIKILEIRSDFLEEGVAREKYFFAQTPAG